MLETIYIVRHGFRMTWSVDPYTVRYSTHIPTPTGIPTDPALTGHGERQAEQLGAKLASLEPPIDQVLSSPYYRCLQTISPAVRRLKAERGYERGVILESGFEEWYGRSWDIEQPGPLEYETMQREFFEDMGIRWDETRESSLRPSKFGEGIEQLHERVAFALHRLIKKADENGWKAVVVCTHAAVMIAAGRVLTGQMPKDISEEDFHCFTASLSQYNRRHPYQPADDLPYDPSSPERLPSVAWEGRGVAGGWDSLLNGDCSFLESGEERGWHFSGDEAFLRNPNAANDREHLEKERREQDTRERNRAVCVAAGKAEDDEEATGGHSKL